MVNSRDKSMGWNEEEELLVAHPSGWFDRTSSPGAGKLFDDSGVQLMLEKIPIRLLNQRGDRGQEREGIPYHVVTCI